MKNILLTTLLALTLTACGGAEEDVVKIGYIASYTSAPAHIKRAQNAFIMAVEEANAQGGVAGKKVVYEIRDDRGSASDGVQVAQELISGENVDVLVNTSYGHVTLAISEMAGHTKTPLFASWCGVEDCVRHPYIFATEEKPSSGAKVLAKQAAKSDAKRWAFVGNTIEWSLSVSESFRQEMKKRRPDISFVDEQFTPYNKTLAGAVVQSLRKNDVEAIHISLIGKDLIGFIREARKRKLLHNVDIYHPYLAPEEVAPYMAEFPAGWTVLTYPEGQIPQAQAFEDAYQTRFEINPGMAGVLTYTTTKLALAATEKAESLTADAIAAAARGVSVKAPTGTVQLDAQTQRSTYRHWLARTVREGGKILFKPLPMPSVNIGN